MLSMKAKQVIRNGYGKFFTEREALKVLIELEEAGYNVAFESGNHGISLEIIK